MPEDLAYISSKSRVDTSRDGKVMSVAKKVWTDRQTAFRLYIVDACTLVCMYVCMYALGLGNISIYCQYREIRSCNNDIRLHKVNYLFLVHPSLSFLFFKIEPQHQFYYSLRLLLCIFSKFLHIFNSIAVCMCIYFLS